MLTQDLINTFKNPFPIQVSCVALLFNFDAEGSRQFQN